MPKHGRTPAKFISGVYSLRGYAVNQFGGIGSWGLGGLETDI